MGGTSEISREKLETEHWRLACLVLKHHNHELMMECSQLKQKYEVGFKEGVEISRKHDDPSVIIYKRKKCADFLEDDQRGKCQKCAELNREIDDLKLMKKRDAAEIEDLRINCMEMDIEVTALSNHGIDSEKELEAYKIKCLSLSAELQRKGTELENLAEINGGLDRQCEEYRAKCIEMEEKIKGLIEEGIVMSVELQRKGTELENLLVVNGSLDRECEDYKIKCTGMEEKIKGLIEEGIVMSGIVMSERETSARERICHLEEVIKKMETDQDAYKIKCQGLSAELNHKGVELEDLREVNSALDLEREHYRTKCSGMEEQIKGLIEGGAEKEVSARERICHLEALVKKMETDQSERCKELETRLSKVEEENSALRGLQNVVSCEKTCRQMDGRVDAAHLTRTETSPSSSFALSCKPPTLQVNFDGVPASDLAVVNNLCKSAISANDYFASAARHQGRLTRFRKCSGAPSTENLALLRQEDGARPSTTSPIVAIDGENENVYISDRGGKKSRRLPETYL